MENRDIYPKVFTWLFIGLLITFITGYSLSLNPNLLYGFSGMTAVILIIAEVAIALFFSFRLQKMSKNTAIVCYGLYSIITGITLSGIFIIYKLTSIIYIFLIAAALFLVFAIIGKTTKLDLSKLGTYLFMILFAVIVLSVVNIFLGLETMELIICIISIVVFLGYIAYDMQKVRSLVSVVGEDKAAIFGAFQLYLDFINLFIDLLRLLGKSND
ncbi:MAG: Bax inhibitor-1/YccA family protein [Bacilli bacterium]|nr:Bax inhibitor-1/YccA family protein [Bacilli bacterium]